MSVAYPTDQVQYLVRWLVAAAFATILSCGDMSVAPSVL